jgi:hypothetical protein
VSVGELAVPLRAAFFEDGWQASSPARRRA